jgi:hypothetical protein
MPITAIPAGIELRKISVTQKKALDELLQKQNGMSVLNTAILVGIPALVIGLGAAAFLFKDEIKETVKEEWENIKSFAEGIPAGIFTGAIDAGFGLGKEITGIDLEKTTGEAAEVFGADVGICQQYEYDLVSLAQRVDDTPSWNLLAKAALGVNIRSKLKGMKAQGCSKPAFTPSEDWSRV